MFTTFGSKRARLLLAVAILCAAMPAGAKAPIITTFDVPGAGEAAGQGTLALSTNGRGTTMGYYLDASNMYHAFLRAKNGSTTTIDVPGAGTAVFQGTVAFGLNSAGAVAGYYIDASYLRHGYLRAADGTITTFDVPGSTQTRALNINPTGVILGSWRGASGVNHGFVRDVDGTITTFDAPGAGTGNGQGTLSASVSGLNQDGAAVLVQAMALMAGY